MPHDAGGAAVRAGEVADDAQGTAVLQGAAGPRPLRGPRGACPSPGELRRWVQRFGAQALLDPDSRSYVEQGLRYVSASDEDWIRRMVADPGVLRLPLARCGTDLAVGDDPKAWQRFADAVKGG
ncbi:MAG: arsenate reductase family protein [Egibacteraceae bacterium]